MLELVNTPCFCDLFALSAGLHLSFVFEFMFPSSFVCFVLVDSCLYMCGFDCLLLLFMFWCCLFQHVFFSQCFCVFVLVAGWLNGLVD